MNTMNAARGLAAETRHVGTQVKAAVDSRRPLSALQGSVRVDTLRTVWISLHGRTPMKSVAAHDVTGIALGVLSYGCDDSKDGFDVWIIRDAYVAGVVHLAGTLSFKKKAAALSKFNSPKPLGMSHVL